MGKALATERVFENLNTQERCRDGGSEGTVSEGKGRDGNGAEGVGECPEGREKDRGPRARRSEGTVEGRSQEGGRREVAEGDGGGRERGVMMQG